MVDEHAARGPDHADEAFDNHHAVERLAARLFGDFGAGHERALRAVETADDAAGNSDEEHRDNGLVARMLREVRGDITQVEFVKHVQVRGDAYHDAEGGEDEHAAENRVDAPDNLVDGEERTRKVVGENHADRHPEERGGHCAARDDGRVDELCRRVGEHGAHEDERDRDEPHHQLGRTLAQELAREGGNIVAVIAHADHAAEVVVHRTAQHVT